ncbi:hypothetical protein QBC41DRAFT_130823 [Cercophora samala]|uniref:Uncharacterized protein n=1 Tax=Cercophora samala TaxID=330535 RepID=A0AA39ZBH0_9PEZI|nr:hypothetical protein QBC41DRAFT_130823 [Cercophora samala]
MSVNKRKVASMSGVRSKLERYCHLGDRMRENNLAQDELMIMCQERPNYSSLGKVLRQRLLMFLDTERKEADIWRKAVADKFPGWFDLAGKKEEVPQNFLKDWEVFKELGWFGDSSSGSDSIPTVEQRQRENTIPPDTQLERLVAVSILVESLVRDKLEEEKRTPDHRGYVEAAVQTDAPYQSLARCASSAAQPPVLVTSQAASKKPQGYATRSRGNQALIRQSPEDVDKAPPLRDALLLTSTNPVSSAPPLQQLRFAPKDQPPEATSERSPKRQRRTYTYSSSSSSEYSPDSGSLASSSSWSLPEDDSLSILEETSVRLVESDVDQQPDWRQIGQIDQQPGVTDSYIQSLFEPAWEDGTSRRRSSSGPHV